MTAAQQQAFTRATGHAAGDVSTIIASILTVLLFMWATWLILRVLASLRETDSNTVTGDLIRVGLRASALIWIALYIVQ